ncbi:MAG: hypothetical protein RIS24_3094 [Verrucomicrobiota bacterium]
MMNPLAAPPPQSKAGRIESILARLIPYENTSNGSLILPTMRDSL